MSVPRTPHGANWQGDSSKQERNRRAFSSLSPIAAIPLETLLSGRVIPFPVRQPQHVNPPLPLFKIPRSEWPQVVQRVAQGESLRQIARSYHTSYEGVRRVLQASRQEMLANPDERSPLNRENAER